MKNFSTNSFIAGVMLGVLLASALFIGGSYPIAPVQSPSLFATTSTNSLIQHTQESGVVSVVNQTYGDSVTVESITVPPPGIWAAVREINGDQLGNVLGAARVKGPRSFVVISLLRATEPNRQYAVELYRDDADGEFDPARNSVYVDFNTGAPAISYFTTN